MSAERITAALADRYRIEREIGEVDFGYCAMPCIDLPITPRAASTPRA